MNRYIKQYAPVLESTDDSSISDDLMIRLVNDALNSIFLNKDDSVILLSFDKPKYDPIDSAISSDDGEYNLLSANYEITLDCLYVGHPELDEELKSLGARRFSVSLEFETHFSYKLDSDGTLDEIDDVSTDITSILFNYDEIDVSDVSDEFIYLISDIEYGDILSIFYKNGKTQFIQ